MQTRLDVSASRALALLCSVGHGMADAQLKRSDTCGRAFTDAPDRRERIHRGPSRKHPQSS